ncbi:unnamed protein product, partial [Mesorhabditis spiculigera]
MDSDFDETITGRLGLELKRGSVSPTRYIVQWKQRTKESKTHDETQWITASVEHEPIINVEGMMPGLLYRFQVTAIGPSGRLGDAVTSDWIEATNSKTEIPPFEGLLIAKNGYDSDHGVNALITWPKSSENSCGYRITYSNSTHITTKDSEVDSSAGILLTNLEFDAAYTVQIRSLGAKLDDSIVSLPISSSFKTFSCSQIHGRGSINCPPEPVDEFKVEVHVNGTVNLSWRPIAGVDNILTYRIEYYAQENEPKCDSMTRTIYLKAAADSATISVDPGCRYTVKLTNFDLIGREAAIEREFSVNLSRPLLSFPLNWQILLTIFLFCLVLFVICLLKCTLSARCRQKVNEKKNKLVGEFAQIKPGMDDKSTEQLWIPDPDLEQYLKDQRKKRVSRFFQVVIGTVLAGCVLYYLLAVDRKNYEDQFDGVEYEQGIEMEKAQFEELYDLYSEQFKDFMKRYARDYESGEETMDRFKTYMKNMEEAEKLNRERKYGGEYGENDMADWTDEEFKKILLPVTFYKKLRSEATFIQKNPPQMEQAAALPDHLDWREKNGVSPVKAQGKCGSCWAFAATATVESAWLIKDGKYRNLSEQTLLDCDFSNNACDGGDEDKAFRFIHRTGLAFNKDLPYVAHRQNSCELVHKETTKIKIAYFLHQDEYAMRQWMVNFGPVNVGMSVTQPMRSYKCNTTECGVFTPDPWECKNKVIGLHALLAVGYGTDPVTKEDYWIIKNSWGSDWGDHGFIKFRRGQNACGIEDEPVGIMA